METTFASISSSVKESTGNPTEIAIRASTSQSLATSFRRVEVPVVSSVKNFFRRRRFRGGGFGSGRVVVESGESGTAGSGVVWVGKEESGSSEEFWRSRLWGDIATSFSGETDCGGGGGGGDGGSAIVVDDVV